RLPQGLHAHARDRRLRARRRDRSRRPAGRPPGFVPPDARLAGGGREPQLSRMKAMSSSYNDDLGLAHLLADSAARIASDRFRSSDLRVSTKPDMTEVSDAD